MELLTAVQTDLVNFIGFTLRWVHSVFCDCLHSFQTKITRFSLAILILYMDDVKDWALKFMTDFAKAHIDSSLSVFTSASICCSLFFSPKIHRKYVNMALRKTTIITEV